MALAWDSRIYGASRSLFIDGDDDDEFPTICGSGTEDYLLNHLDEREPAISGAASLGDGYLVWSALGFEDQEAFDGRGVVGMVAVPVRHGCVGADLLT